jgi:hypothetical protein
MREQSLHGSVDARLPSAQPNFDDERTLLTARPVVPLAKIDAKERHLRHWLLGGAFALAMMLGAASALLASYLKLRNAPSSVTEISEQVETSAAPLAVAPEVVASELPVAENPEEQPEEVENTADAAPVTLKKAPVRRRMIPRGTELVRPRVVGEIDREGELQRIREAVLYDSWEERRARRAARRERRNRVDHHGRDLSNLDEIFEGPRRRPY